MAGISLSQIAYVNVEHSEINIGFTDGGNLKLLGQASTGFALEGVVYVQQAAGVQNNLEFRF